MPQRIWGRARGSNLRSNRHFQERYGLFAPDVPCREGRAIAFVTAVTDSFALPL
jgi:hypothetical protein